jgi:mannosyltransferase
MALAALLGVICISCESLWLDEASSYWIARLDGGELLKVAFTLDRAMPLYYLLLHAWIALGTAEWILRGLSVVFAVASVGAMYRLGRTLFGRTVGFASAALLAINPVLLFFAQEARGYTLVILLTIICSAALVRAIEDPSFRWWALYGVSGVMAILAQPQAAFALIGHAVSLLFVRDRVARVRALVTLVAIAAVSGPYLVPIVWQEGLDPSEGIEGAVRSLRSQAKWGLLFLLVCAPLLIRAVVRARASGHRRWSVSWRYALLFAWLVMPLVLRLLYPGPVPGAERYVVVSLPPLTLLLASSLVGLRRRVVRVALAMALIVACAVAIQAIYAEQRKEDWRSVVRYVLTRDRPRDAFVFFDLTVSAPFTYYAERMGVGTSAFAYPEWRWRTSDWDDGERPSVPGAFYEDDLLFGGAKRVWMLTSHAGARYSSEGKAREWALLQTLLKNSYRADPQRGRSFRGVGVSLYVLRF